MMMVVQRPPAKPSTTLFHSATDPMRRPRCTGEVRCRVSPLRRCYGAVPAASNQPEVVLPIWDKTIPVMKLESASDARKT
jgi:hypothetical protein